MMSFNVEGFRRNRSYLTNLIQSSIYKIIFLQEIWLNYHDLGFINNSFPEFTFSISTPDMFMYEEDKLLRAGPIWHGAAIGWHDDVSTKVNVLDSNHERLAAIQLNFSSGTLLLVSYYAPTAGNDDDYLESLSCLSQFIIQNTSVHHNVIIRTEFNCSQKSTQRRKYAWSKFCKDFNLVIHSTNQNTFHHNNGTSESCIDFFVATEPVAVFDIKLHCTLENPEDLSSHDPITATLKVMDDSEKQSSKFLETYTDFVRERIVWEESKLPEYQTLVAEALADASEYWDTSAFVLIILQANSAKCETCVRVKESGLSQTPRSL